MSLEQISTPEQILESPFFWADWHDPSKPGGQMDSVFKALSTRYPSIAFAKLEAESVDTAGVAEGLGVSVVPTFVAVLNGKAWNKVEGANPAGRPCRCS